jgi:hypothetical protein
MDDRWTTDENKFPFAGIALFDRAPAYGFAHNLNPLSYANRLHQNQGTRTATEMARGLHEPKQNDNRATGVKRKTGARERTGAS